MSSIIESPLKVTVMFPKSPGTWFPVLAESAVPLKTPSSAPRAMAGPGPFSDSGRQLVQRVQRAGGDWLCRSDPSNPSGGSAPGERFARSGGFGDHDDDSCTHGAAKKSRAKVGGRVLEIEDCSYLNSYGRKTSYKYSQVTPFIESI